MRCSINVRSLALKTLLNFLILSNCSFGSDAKITFVSCDYYGGINNIVKFFNPKEVKPSKNLNHLEHTDEGLLILERYYFLANQKLTNLQELMPGQFCWGNKNADKFDTLTLDTYTVLEWEKFVNDQDSEVKLTDDMLDKKLENKDIKGFKNSLAQALKAYQTAHDDHIKGNNQYTSNRNVEEKKKIGHLILQ